MNLFNLYKEINIFIYLLININVMSFTRYSEKVKTKFYYMQRRNISTNVINKNINDNINFN